MEQFGPRLDPLVRAEVRKLILEYKQEGFTSKEIAELINDTQGISRRIGKSVDGAFVDNQYAAAKKALKKGTALDKKSRTYFTTQAKITMQAKKVYPNSFAWTFIRPSLDTKYAATARDDLEANGSIIIIEEKNQMRVKATNELMRPPVRAPVLVNHHPTAALIKPNERDIQLLKELIVESNKIDSKTKLRLLDLVSTLEKD